MFTSEGIKVISVDVVNEIGCFIEDINFDISFHCLKPVNEISIDVIWHSLTTRENQILVEATIGPIQVGVNRLVLPAPAPKCAEIPDAEVTLRAKYQDQCFYSIVFHARNEAPAEGQDFSMMRRSICAAPQGSTVREIRW